MDPLATQDKDLHRVVPTGIIWRVNDAGRYEYLITKRSDKKHFENKWHVPGGGLKSSDYLDETASHLEEGKPQWYNAVERALRREIREEVGLEVEDIQYLLDVIYIRPDNIPVIVFCYSCKYVSGEVTLDNEDAVDFRWITVDDVGDYDLIAGIDGEIRQVEERLNKK